MDSDGNISPVKVNPDDTPVQPTLNLLSTPKGLVGLNREISTPLGVHTRFFSPAPWNRLYNLLLTVFTALNSASASIKLGGGETSRPGREQWSSQSSWA